MPILCRFTGSFHSKGVIYSENSLFQKDLKWNIPRYRDIGQHLPSKSSLVGHNVWVLGILVTFLTKPEFRVKRQPPLQLCTVIRLRQILQFQGETAYGLAGFRRIGLRADLTAERKTDG